MNNLFAWFTLKPIYILALKHRRKEMYNSNKCCISSKTCKHVSNSIFKITATALFPYDNCAVCDFSMKSQHISHLY